MSPSGEELMAAAVLSNDADPTRLSWEEVEKSWGSWFSFMRSYGLKPWDQEDCEKALSISRALKQGHHEQFLMDVIYRLTQDKPANLASGGANKAVTYKDCEEALAISRRIKQFKEWKDEQEEQILLDGIAKLGLTQDQDESPSIQASGEATKAVTYKDLPDIGKWINWNEGEEIKAEVMGYEDDYAGYCQNTEKTVNVKFMDRTEDSLCQKELERYNWSYCEAPCKEQIEKAMYEELNQFIGDRSCNACNCKDKKLHLCTGCYKVYYCDATCQIPDWNTHKNNCKREKIVLKPNPRYPLSKVSNKVKKSQIQTQEKYHQVLQDALDGNFTAEHLDSSVDEVVPLPVKNPKAGSDLKTCESYRLTTNNGMTWGDFTWEGLEAHGHSKPEGKPTSCTLLAIMYYVLKWDSASGLHNLAQGAATGKGEEQIFWGMIINFNTFGTVAPYHGPCDCNPSNVKAQMPPEWRELRKKWNKILKRAKDDINDMQCMFSDSEEGCHNFSDCPYKHDIEVKKEKKKKAQ